MAITWNGGCGSGGGGSYIPGEGIDIAGNVISAIMNATNTFTKTEVEAMLDALESIYASKSEATYTAGDGLVLTNKQFAVSVPRVGSGTNANRLPAQTRFRIEEFPAGSPNLPTTNAWYQIYEAHSTDPNYGTQLALGMTTDAAYYRKFSAGSWGPWRRLDVEYGVASTRANGLMSSADKTRLDNMGFRVVAATANYTPTPPAGIVNFTVNVPSGYTAVGVVGAATGNPGAQLVTVGLDQNNNFAARLDYRAEAGTWTQQTARIRVLCMRL